MPLAGKAGGSESVPILQNICELVLEFPSVALHIRLPFSACGKKNVQKRTWEKGVEGKWRDKLLPWCSRVVRWLSNSLVFHDCEATGGKISKCSSLSNQDQAGVQPHVLPVTTDWRIRGAFGSKETCWLTQTGVLLRADDRLVQNEIVLLALV